MTPFAPQGPLYTPLYEWQTRLLYLQPGRKQEPLQATLHVVDLVHAEGVQLHGTARRVQYEALSYTWGDSKRLRSIQVNGTLTNVTENLYHALLALRTKEEQRCLWIDALCIHQADLEEKSQHLQRMFLIFRKAIRVIVFLGRKGPNTAHAFEYLRARKIDQAHAKDIETIDNLPRLYHGLRDLWDRPWIWRIWVRQEVFAAHRIFVFCGDEHIKWEEFFGLCESVEHLTQDMQLLGIEAHSLEPRAVRTFQNLGYAEPDALSRILNDEYPDERGSTTDIVQVLRNSAGCEMSDPRDVVYGILGMTTTKTGSLALTTSDEGAEKNDILRLAVDYCKDLASVFEDLAKYIFKRDRSLHILYLCQDPESRRNDVCLPSWCPDWRHERPDTIAALQDRLDEWLSSWISIGFERPRAMPLTSQEPTS